MPKVKTNRVKYPEGWELIEPTLRELDAKMREAELDTHDGKRKCETLWPIFKVAHQRSRYVYDLYYRREEISKELYEFCLDQGYADRSLIAKWKKMPRRPSGRRVTKIQPLAFSPFMRSLAFASSSSKRKLPHPQDSQSSDPELMSFEEKVPNLSKKAKKEEFSDSSDDEDSEGDVQADFEFFDPKPTDFHGVKILLQNYLDVKEWDLSSFVDLILEQTTVGTVVKVADDEDEAVFAVVSALNLARYKDHKCFRELKEFLLKVCSEKNIASDLKMLLEKKPQEVGVLVSQRVMNLPPQLLPPLYDGLFDEVTWATEDEPTEALRSSFRFKSYILITKIYKLKNPNQRKPRHGEEEIEETVFLKPEDELFLELSTWSFTFPMRSQLVTSQEMKNYQLMGLVMYVKADKIPEFRKMLNSLIDGQ